MGNGVDGGEIPARTSDRKISTGPVENSVEEISEMLTSGLKYFLRIGCPSSGEMCHDLA